MVLYKFDVDLEYVSFDISVLVVNYVVVKKKNLSKYEGVVGN